VTSVGGAFRSVTTPTNDYASTTPYTGAVSGGAFTTQLAVPQPASGSIGAIDLVRSADYRPIHLLDFVSSTFPISQSVASPALPPWALATAATTASTASRTASWSVVASPASAHDGELLHMSWTHTVAGIKHPSQWDVIAPPGQTSFAFPALPAALADTQPAGADPLTATTRVFEIPSIASHDELRALPSANLMCLECAVRTHDVARVVYTEL
jgi:hypothetical protein